MLKRLNLILLGLFFCSSPIKADILLLVHGFQSDMLTWQRSGITPILEKHGYLKTDFFIAAPQGLVPIHTPEKQLPKNKIVSIHLNSELKLRFQADQITAVLRYLADLYPNEPVILVGHSLGGVSARLALVKNGKMQVTGLITIASPHLGTGLAGRGLNELNDNMFSRFAKRFFGGGKYQVLERSRSVLYDILPERPGNLLYSLNRQPHPKIAYLSVVRSFDNGMLGDIVVPGFSQDMHYVQAINQQSQRILQGKQHHLTPEDAYSILNALDSMNKK